MVIFRKIKSQKDKIVNSIDLLKFKKGKKCELRGRRSNSCCRNENGGFREVSDFSLDLRQIRPSAVFGTRKRTTLRGEGFAWVSDLGSFLKLREVGVSPYLSFILRLITMLMFRLVEALNDRLIGSKPWNRNAWI